MTLAANSQEPQLDLLITQLVLGGLIVGWLIPVALTLWCFSPGLACILLLNLPDGLP